MSPIISGPGAPDGGSQPLAVARLSATHATPNIFTTGVVLYIPSAGDLVTVALAVSIPTAWNGTTPTGYLVSQGDTPAAAALQTFDMTALNNTSNSTHYALYQFQNSPILNYELLDSTPLMIVVTDGSGGNPGSTLGEAEFTLVVLKAA